MQAIGNRIKARATELLQAGEVSRVLGWEAGGGAHDWSPAVFETADEMRDFVYGAYAGANLSKYCLKYNRAQGKTLVVLKPCDTLSFHQLMKEHRLDRAQFYIIGAGCKGMRDLDGMLPKCNDCKGKDFVVSDEIIDDEESRQFTESDRFAGVRMLEEMTSDERFEFWRGELSRCIRCNACRNVCPACSCFKCVFDNKDSGVEGKAHTSAYAENAYHIVRAYHVAGRCTDCGECARVCPQNIPLMLLNRKTIKDINELYGEHQAGEGDGERTPLVMYDAGDAEPGIVSERGRA
ncbi:MAG: 4Fe-4S dicluster domain-containing protein [Christensenellales bacterium]|jgi:formate dehydrogenase subunit beta